MSKIHPTAVIEPGAELDGDVEVDAYAVIGANVKIGAGTRIGPHAVITGHTTIGRGNRIFQFVSLGAEPQDKKYAGEPTRLEIGDNNTIREFCTFNTGTVQDLGYTRIGNDNWVMAYVHIAHDCVIGDHTILANNSTLAGHVHIHDWVVLGGMTAIHQFCRLGAHSFTGGASVLRQDLPPYIMCAGNPAEPRTINAEGLRRRGFSAEAIAAIKRAYKTLYRSGLPLDEARKAIAAEASQHPELQILSDFLAQTERGFAR